jgi:predicted GIY-YIG superfamily endonuclease
VADQPLADNGNMFYTYVLKSLKNGKKYIGQTSKDVFSRLKEHNSGSNKWTRANNPFAVLYFEEYDTKTESIKREHFLKSGQGRKWLNENIPQ